MTSAAPHYINQQARRSVFVRMRRTFVSLPVKKPNGTAIMGNRVGLVRWLSGWRRWGPVPGAPESKEDTDFLTLSSDLRTCIPTHN